MQIRFTRHAKGRMRWRRITKGDVLNTLRSPLQRETIGPNRFHYYGKPQRRILRVTLTIENEVLIIITVVEKYTL